MKVTQAPFSTLVTTDREGIVLLGAGGDPQEWINGVFKIWQDEGHVKADKVGEVFEKAILLKTSGGRTDLALIWKRKAKINIGSLALWRLRFGDCSWVSDYKVTYASQHN
jgi:hypothetical protein